jgi:hypothetical protein
MRGTCISTSNLALKKVLIPCVEQFMCSHRDKGSLLVKRQTLNFIYFNRGIILSYYVRTGSRHLNDTHVFDFGSSHWSLLRCFGVPPAPRDSHIGVIMQVRYNTNADFPLCSCYIFSFHFIWHLKSLDILSCAVLCCAVLCCAVLCCAVLCCAVLRCAVLCCAVLCCAVLCCAVLSCPILSCLPSISLVTYPFVTNPF